MNQVSHKYLTPFQCSCCVMLQETCCYFHGKPGLGRSSSGTYSPLQEAAKEGGQQVELTISSTSWTSTSPCSPARAKKLELEKSLNLSPQTSLWAAKTLKQRLSHPNRLYILNPECVRILWVPALKNFRVRGVWPENSLFRQFPSPNRKKCCGLLCAQFRCHRPPT